MNLRSMFLMMAVGVIGMKAEAKTVSIPILGAGYDSLALSQTEPGCVAGNAKVNSAGSGTISSGTFFQWEKFISLAWMPILSTELSITKSQFSVQDLFSNEAKTLFARETYEGPLSRVVFNLQSPIEVATVSLSEVPDSGVSGKNCGDSFVSSITYGFSYNLAVRFDFASSEQVISSENLLASDQARLSQLDSRTSLTVVAYANSRNTAAFHKAIGLGKEGFLKAQCSLTEIQNCRDLAQRIVEYISKAPETSGDTSEMDVKTIENNFVPVSVSLRTFMDTERQGSRAYFNVTRAQKATAKSLVQLFADNILAERLLNGNVGTLNAQQKANLNRSVIAVTPNVAMAYLSGASILGFTSFEIEKASKLANIQLYLDHCLAPRSMNNLEAEEKFHIEDCERTQKEIGIYLENLKMSPLL